MVEKRVFGKTKSGEVVYAFTVKDGERSAVILTYGGAVQSLVVPDREGNPVDVLLGYDTLREYEEGDAFFGALIGRVGNRLGGAKFSIDGTEYRVSRNEPFHSLHGGFRGFDKVVWQGEEIENGVKLSYLSKDGEEGYPGNLQVEVRYTFFNGEFSVDYHAVSDKATAIAMTWHGYFNLNGAGRESGTDNFLQIRSDEILPSDENLLPTGEFRKVKGTPFDFNEAKRMGKDLFADDIDLKHGKGTIIVSCSGTASGLKNALKRIPSGREFAWNALPICLRCSFTAQTMSIRRARAAIMRRTVPMRWRHRRSRTI